jgi:hypoxanthine-guanine phosphoribosyltransferase
LNVRGAFSVSDPAAVSEKHILVIDDIFTTGATARAAAQALTRAGAASVWVATLARARRTNQFSRASSFEDADNNVGLTRNLPAITTQQASIYSSQGQPSF